MSHACLINKGHGICRATTSPRSYRVYTATLRYVLNIVPSWHGIGRQCKLKVVRAFDGHGQLANVRIDLEFEQDAKTGLCER